MFKKLSLQVSDTSVDEDGGGEEEEGVGNGKCNISRAVCDVSDAWRPLQWYSS